MNRQNSYVSPKEHSTHQDVQQFNAIVSLVKDKKCGVRPTSLDDFTVCLQLFSKLLWELDPHYYKFKARGINFNQDVEKNFLGFNDPKTHGHSVKQINIESLMSKTTTLALHLERKYMFSSHMKPVADIISSAVDGVCRYNEYVLNQNARVSKHHSGDEPQESAIDNYSVKKLNQTSGEQRRFSSQLRSLQIALNAADVYVPLVISDIVDMERKPAYQLYQLMREKGFPTINQNCEVYYYRLPSHGPNPSVNFVWKGKTDDIRREEENSKVVASLQENQTRYYNRATRKSVRETLHRIGITKPQRAEYLLRSLLGDASAPNDQNQKGVLERLNRYVKSWRRHNLRFTAQQWANSAVR